MLRYERTGEANRILVILNMATEPVQVTIAAGSVLVSTYLDREGNKVSGQIDLRATEGLVVALD